MQPREKVFTLSSDGTLKYSPRREVTADMILGVIDDLCKVVDIAPELLELTPEAKKFQEHKDKFNKILSQHTKYIDPNAPKFLVGRIYYSLVFDFEPTYVICTKRTTKMVSFNYLFEPYRKRKHHKSSRIIKRNDRYGPRNKYDSPYEVTTWNKLNYFESYRYLKPLVKIPKTPLPRFAHFHVVFDFPLTTKKSDWNAVDEKLKKQKLLNDRNEYEYKVADGWTHDLLGESIWFRGDMPSEYTFKGNPRNLETAKSNAKRIFDLYKEEGPVTKYIIVDNLLEGAKKHYGMNYVELHNRNYPDNKLKPCKSYRRTKNPKCDDQPHCKWEVRTGCIKK